MNNATHPSAPPSPRHAALLVLVGMSPPRPRALPGTPMATLTGAFNCRFWADLPEIGSQGVVSQILSGKRQLNARQIAALSVRFGVAADAFLEPVE